MAKTEKKDFETQLGRLQVVVDQLEQGDVSLEKSLILFKEGQELVQDCQARLAAARHQGVSLAEIAEACGAAQGQGR